MGDHVELRPAAEEDLLVLEKLTWDPATAGEFARFGWFDLRMWRRGWAENRLIGDDGGVLMVVHGAEQIGFALLAAARGHGYGTAAHRLLARYLFAHTTAHRIQAVTEVDNVAECNAL